MLAAADRPASLRISPSGPSTLSSASKSPPVDPPIYNAADAVASDTEMAAVQGRASSVREPSRARTSAPRYPQRPCMDEIELEEGRGGGGGSGWTR